MPALLALALLLLVTACAPVVRHEGVNVVVIVIDTLRSDRLSAYGAKQRYSRFLDRIAEEGFCFRRAFAPSTWTKPSIGSLMTGRYPGRHGALGNLVFNRNLIHLDERYTTLAERLKEAGYRTAALVTNPHILPQYHFDQGFDEFTQPVGRAERLFSRAAEWVKRAGSEEPFFLYLHAVDPHSPYFPPERYRRKSAAADPGPDAPFARRGEFVEIALWLDQFRDWAPAHEDDTFSYDYEAADIEKRVAQIAPNLALEDLSSIDLDFSGMDDPKLKKRIEYLIALYNTEVIYANDALESFVAALKMQGMLENTVLVVTSDHGEAFLEHDAWGHGHDVHAEEIEVPLLFRIPRNGGAYRGASDEPVSLIDIFPTLLDLIGLEAEDGVDGISLWPVISSQGRDALPDRYVFSETITQRADYLGAIKGEKKLMRTAVEGRGIEWRFYDLAADPGERRPMDREAAGEDAEVFEGAIERHLEERTVDLDGQGIEVTPSADEIRQLRELGYL
jgi:arylsulfatase A-like enzyme